MSLTDFLSNFTSGTPESTALLVVAIVLCTTFLEDITIVVVGVLAADGLVAPSLALISMYVGSFIADSGLFGLGALARTQPRLAQYIDHDFTAPFLGWLRARFKWVILAGHFVPGLRSMTYTASGFFRFSFLSFLPRAIISSVALVTLLFTLSYGFGSLSAKWIGPMRWGAAVLFLLALFFVGRHNLKLYQARNIARKTEGYTTGNEG
jgi:membrane protein DedA with SNARE-associated domain